MEMKEFLLKSLAFGLGTAAFGAEKLAQFTEDMVKRGEMSSDDAKKLLDDASKRAVEEKEKLKVWVSEQVTKLHQQTGAAQAERIADLEARIAELEMKLGTPACDTVDQTGE